MFGVGVKNAGLVSPLSSPTFNPKEVSVIIQRILNMPFTTTSKTYSVKALSSSNE